MTDVSSTPPSRRGGKAPGAFRTISEVADVLDVPQHVLRFWESKFSQVKPMKRGGGRRYYRPEDVDILRGIRHLLYTDGYTIKGVQKLFRENGVRAVMAEMKANPSAAGVAGAQVLKKDDTGSAQADAGSLSPAQKETITKVIEELTSLKGKLLSKRD
jgi:DNA-binding transcriptional MerR regulator